MRFLVDAQLPARLARYLTDAGHDALHSSDLPAGNRTTDEEIARRADTEDRVVVTKDRDFRDGHLLRGRPGRLLIVATGNTDNHHLVRLFDQHLADIVGALAEVRFVELAHDRLIVHEDR